MRLVFEDVHGVKVKEIEVEGASLRRKPAAGEEATEDGKLRDQGQARPDPQNQ